MTPARPRELAERCEQHTLSARAFGGLAEADAAHGSYDAAFEVAATPVRTDR